MGRGDPPIINSYSVLNHMNDFEQQWNEYRKRRNLVAFAFIGYVPIVGTLGFVSSKVLHTETAFFVLAFSWMAFFAVAFFRLTYWPCPRCGKWFAERWWYHNPSAQRCVHCGLPKYSNC